MDKEQSGIRMKEVTGLIIFPFMFLLHSSWFILDFFHSGRGGISCPIEDFSIMNYFNLF